MLVSSFNNFFINESKFKQQWTKSDVAKIAKEYSSMGAFFKGNNLAYQAAYRNKWLNDVTAHMTKRGNWTKSVVADIAKKYTTLKAFTKGDNHAYQAAYRNKWLKDITTHMIPSGFHWTEEMLIELANKYDDLSTFIDNEPSAVRAARKQEIFKKITAHMKPKMRKPRKPQKLMWTKSTIAEVAKKYPTMKAFAKGDYSAYQTAHRNKWIKDVTQHMDIVKRKLWTEEEAFKITKNIDDVADFYKNHQSLYHWAHRRGLIPALTQHMSSKRTKWTKEILIDIANKYDNLSTFITNEPKVVTAARGRGILKQITAHMKSDRWTEEKVAEIAKNYEYFSDFNRDAPLASSAAKNRGWYDRVTKHMISKPPLFTKEQIMKLAVPIGTKVKFKELYPEEYDYAAKRMWIKDITNHMSHEYTKAQATEIAKKYPTREKFKTGKDSKVYYYAYAKGWLDDITIHMGKNPRPKITDIFIEAIKKYKTQEDLKIAEPTLYKIAFKLGWIKKYYTDRWSKWSNKRKIK